MAARWIELPPDAIAESVRDLLASALGAEAVSVELRDPASG